MNHYQTNSDWCRRANPDLWRRIEASPDSGNIEVVPSRSGASSARIGGVWLHSAYDPAREADTVAAKSMSGISSNDIVVICGLGLGYPLEAIRRHFNGKIVVVEPDLGMVRAAFTARDLSPLSSVAMAFGLSSESAAESIASTFSSDRDWRRVRLIQHAPSVQLHSEYFAQLARIINARRNSDIGKLSILVNTPIYGGSLPVARYCASAFARLGHRVETLDNEIYDAARLRLDGISGNRQHRAQLGGMLTTLLAESLTARAMDRAVDLVFCVAQSPMTPMVAAELKRQGIPVAFWFVEDWQLFGYWKDWAPIYDYFFTIQKGGFPDALKRIGVNRSLYLPLAADPEIHRPMTLSPAEQREFGSAVSHVGAGYRNRQRVFSSLTDLDFKLWGNDWPQDTSLRKVLQREGGRLTTEDTVKVFNATQVNLNLHSSAFHDGVNPDGDFVNPRTFELAACGAFQLTDNRALLPELFDVRSSNGAREMALFRHERELRGMIEHYLNHPEERATIAANARRRVLAEHTYDLRMATALKFIYSYEEAPASRKHPNHVDNLLSEAGEDPDLRSLLEGLKDHGVVTLDDVAAEIGKRTGDLTPTEATFLLMHEFRKWAAEKDLV